MTFFKLWLASFGAAFAKFFVGCALAYIAVAFVGLDPWWFTDPESNGTRLLVVLFGLFVAFKD